jgi:asparagine synthase (glutamine-hydrolysing)
MCGIAGYVGERTGAHEVLGAMAEALVHRGPDEDGFHVADGVGLAIRRLKIIGLAGGSQPYRNETGDIVAVFNGEIYGYRGLKEELQRRGHVFSGTADGEVIVHGYEEFGDDFLDHIDGMFAIALWDSRRRRLLLARDRVGKKPLFWAQHPDGGLSFASEIGSLLQDPLVERTVDPASISSFLRYAYVPAPYSAFRGVRKLSPGSMLTLEDGRVQERRYWRLDYEPKVRISRNEAVEELDRLAREAVRARLLSEVPLGAFLSGGIDSSYVVSHMAELSSSPVSTFSIGFDDERFDERSHARTIAGLLGTEHHEEVIRPQDLIDVLPELVRHYGEPYADSSAVPTFYLARLARSQITVALCGDGGDESFGGYDRHFAARIAAAIDHVPQSVREPVLRSAAGMISDGEAKSARQKIYRFLKSVQLDPDDRYADWAGILPRDEVAALAPELGAPHVVLGAGRASNPLDRALAADVAHYLPDDLLTKTDIATMAVSLEARAPLLDHRLMEWAARLPTSFKQRGFGRKKLLLEAVGKRIPVHHFDRPKMGFAAPIGSWLRDELREMMTDLLLSARTAELGYIDQAYLTGIVEDHLAMRGDRSPILWTMLMLELWHRDFIDGDRRATAVVAPSIGRP